MMGFAAAQPILGLLAGKRIAPRCIQGTLAIVTRTFRRCEMGLSDSCFEFLQDFGDAARKLAEDAHLYSSPDWVCRTASNWILFGAWRRQWAPTLMTRWQALGCCN
jgi:hypothetical protein